MGARLLPSPGAPPAIPCSISPPRGLHESITLFPLLKSILKDLNLPDIGVFASSAGDFISSTGYLLVGNGDIGEGGNPSIALLGISIASIPSGLFPDFPAELELSSWLPPPLTRPCVPQNSTLVGKASDSVDNSGAGNSTVDRQRGQVVWE